MTIRGYGLRRMLWLPIALAPCMANAQVANPVAGQALAERYCANCHVIGTTRTQAASDSVPTFHSIANNAAIDEQRLKGFMMVPHPLMPDLQLTRREIDDIAAYIRSLKDR